MKWIIIFAIIAFVFAAFMSVLSEKVEKEDGTVVIDVMTAMIHQRYTISEI